MKKSALIIFLLAFSTGCFLNVIYHDEKKAIGISNDFLRDLINEDYDDAYNRCLSPRLKEILSFDRFVADLKESKEIRGGLKKATFDSYQPVPGQRAIQLYYNVSHEKAGEVLYHFMLEGDAKSGYKISLVDMGNQMQDRRYIGIKRLKIDRHIEITSGN